MLILLRLKLLSVLLLVITSILHSRTFTDVLGRKIVAEIISADESMVTLRLQETKKTYQVSLKILSAADRDFVEEWSKNQAKQKSKVSIKDNFEDPWPSLVSVAVDQEVKIVEEDEEKNRYVYHCPNYAFICDAPLSKNVIKKFSVMFEATREFCRMLPISSHKAHVPGEKTRLRIRLFELEETYLKNGGIQGSAGIYSPSKDEVLVPFASLGLKKVGSSYMYDYKKDSKTLRHELVHQLTDKEYYAPGAGGWFSEGLAEYCANTPYRSGKYIVRNNLSSIKAYATEYGKDHTGGRALGKKFTAPDLKKYMLMPYKDFMLEAQMNYGLGMLVTYYFFHMEEDRSNISNFLKALKEGKKGKDALEVLLNGRSFEDLEQNISRAWRARGVRIEFS